MVSPRAKLAAAHQRIATLCLSKPKAYGIAPLSRSTFRRPLAPQSPADLYDRFANVVV